MKATVDGATYEGSEDEIRRIVSNPPSRPAVQLTFVSWPPPGYPRDDFPRNWDGSPIVTC